MKNVRALILLLCVVGVACCDKRSPQAAPAQPATNAAAGNSGIPSGLLAKDQPLVAQWEMKPLPDDQVNVIVFGDWGDYSSGQMQTAATMAQYVAKTGVQFNAAISTGDNFYGQLESVDDIGFKLVFEDMYDAKRLNFPFYAVLGNHDYDYRKAGLEIGYMSKHPDSRWRMPARWYRVDLPREKPMATFLMLDSNAYDLKQENFEAQFKWLIAELKKPRTTPWLFVVAHHPLFSNGDHGDNDWLQEWWGPSMLHYGVDFYLCGHDHDLQHLQIPGWKTSFLVSGGAGRKPRLMSREDRGPFSRSLNGFAHVKLTNEKATVQFINVLDGTIAHSFERTRDGTIDIKKRGGNDKAYSELERLLHDGSESTDGATTQPTEKPQEGDVK